MAIISSITNFLNDIIWGPWFIWSFLVVGLYFSIRTKFLQVRLIKPMVRLLLRMEKSDKGISSFQALCTALAGRIGTGNIAGVATAIFYGGPGALFWMWMSAFLGASTAFMESALAQLYKIELDGQYRGGPAYFIFYGLKVPWYAMFFSLSTLVACGLFLPGVQANSIAGAFENAWGISPWITGGIVAVVLGLIIFGGIKRIASAAEMIVPFMSIIYILMALIVIILKIGELPRVIGLVFSSAFGANAMFGGLLGIAVSWGVKRGIYSNEAGQGSQPHAAGAAEVSHPAKQGLVQAFSVYIDTLFVCTATGFMILMTGAFNTIGVYGAGGSIKGAEGATFIYEGLPELAQSGTIGPQFTQAGVSALFPSFGASFVAVCLALFAFTTIMSYYYQAESNFAYIFREKQSTTRKMVTLILRLCMVIVVFLCSSIEAPQAWDLGDVGVGLMAWLNVIALLTPTMQKRGLTLLKDYEKKAKEGKDPIFDPAEYPDWDNLDIWKTIHAEYKVKYNQ
ncbi:MAG: alanine:cation symporter family protein [Clostridiales bacterium]|nr:alanine:cation symporter family protein [Clostridiales bacterium]